MKHFKKMTKPLAVVCLLGFAAIAWACSFDPFVINEAPRPDGWPELTPVGEVEVKQYPAYRAARVVADGQTPASDSGMFRPLFNHIQREDIAMTAPVEMTYAGDRPASMAFLYRQPDQGGTGVDDADQRVSVLDAPGRLTASLGVRGRYNADNFAHAVDELNAWLDANTDQWRAVGGPRYLGYNSPFVPGFLRYGEVQVPVEAVE